MKHETRSLLVIGAVALAAIAAGAGCSRQERSAAKTGMESTPDKPRGAPNPLAQAYYKEHPDFFIFASLGDLPADLAWQDGSDLPIFADPNAKRGGTQYTFMESFPPTVRTIGPDSNNGFRAIIHDDNEMSLLHRHPNADGWIGGLAREWAVADDMQTTYFRLDPDARWSDGVPVTTDDILFMFFMFQSRYIQDPFLNNWYSTEYASVTKFDDQTIAIKLVSPKPEPLEPAGYQQYAIPEHFYAELGDDFPQRYQWRVAPTTGPYTIRDGDIEQGRGITLSRIPDWWANNKRFWAHRYNPDRIVVQLVRDRDKAFEMFKLGELDYFNMILPPKYWYDQSGTPEFENGYIQKALFYTYEPRPPIGLFINSKKPLLDNRDVREGICYASNWDKVIQVMMRGDARRLRPWADSHGPFEHPTLRARPFSVERALESFSRAGFTRRGPDGILVNAEGRRLSFTVTFGSVALAEIPPILKEEAAKAGLELLIERLDPTAAYQKTMQKNHEIDLGGWGGGAEFAPRFWEFFHGDNAGKPQTNNLTNTDIPELNDLIDRYKRSTDKAEMIELAHRMIEKIHEDAAYVPGFVQPYIRWANWRWVKYPPWLNVREAQYAGQFGLHWIDEDLKKETLQARREGRTFDATVIVDEKWKTD